MWARSPDDDDLEHQAAGECLAESRQNIVRIFSLSLSPRKGCREERILHRSIRTRSKDTDLGLHDPLGERPMPGIRDVLEPDHPHENLELGPLIY